MTLFGLREQNTGDDDRDHELQDAGSGARNRPQKPAAESLEVGSHLAQRSLEVCGGKAPGLVQVFPDDRPRVHLLRRRRNVQGPVADSRRQRVCGLEQGPGEQEGRDDQECQRHYRDQRCRKLAATAQGRLEPVADGMDRNGNDDPPDDRLEEGLEDVETPVDEQNDEPD